ncbi:Poly [ADP-ribose] polymerase tankyrase [Caenorhabditis elegans]|uniref:Isoform b of Poly [ADP-ribose] polymerase tankyrase n=1 Tax=Caenorhabditis elegans TaxID=6239 RepID=Q9TXQ1-2|nr:Poly [ADP-ribose] polymerase tankyrase [Caenorhabditis elegans]AAN40683.1 poly ADP-ribose metabolism enzyme-5 [Caenorhabditis elegans]CCD69564.1 Poly [ADP-ribose] polymerase tankyrase [Caenorhabditis elegans]|eukprot:NP_001024306.1 Tankyrase-like protein [Caenorhabditis elegans]
MARRVNKKKSPVKAARKIDGQIGRRVVDGVRAKSSRQRHQAVLYQAPTPTVIRRKTTKTAIVKKTVVVVKKGGKVVKKSSKTGQKVKAVKAPKVKAPSKKGNDRLTPRVITEYQENPFFYDPQVPEYISASVYHRWITRAVRNGNMKEIKDYYKSKKCQKSAIYTSFAYSFDTSACDEALRQDIKFATEFFKMNNKMEVDNSYHPGKEPNLLQKKTTGRKNYYMLGRHTRQIEMGRGGKEGNNALLNYDTRTDEPNPLTKLIEDNVTYTKLYQLCKIPDGPIVEHHIEMHFVTAVRMGHRDLASALAQGPVKMHCNDLHRATLKDQKLPAKILPVSVAKKAYMNKNITPLHTAAISNSTHMLEAMRAVYPTINIPDQDNWYTMHYAACAPGTAPMEFLLKNGGSVTMLTKQTETPLHVAARAGRAVNCTFLMKEMLDLEKGDDGESTIRADRSIINARTRSGNSALHLAVLRNNLDVVDALLAEPTIVVDNPTSTGQNRLTPLMMACGKGYLEMAKKLVEKGALVEGKDKKKRTPLIHAMLNGQIHTAAFLLAKGASLTLADSSGNTAAHYAAAYGFLDCLKLLASIDDNILSEPNDWQLYPLSVAYLKGHYGIVTWLLEGPHKDKANINAKDNNGATLLSNLLSYADETMHKELLSQIEYLVARKADASLADSSGQTPLHLFSMQRIILKGSGEAAENDAMRMTLDNYKKCFNTLIKAGAKVDVYDHEDNTPLHYALTNGNLMLFNLMLDKVANKRNLFEKWANHQNFLHEILALPMKVYGDQVLWKGETLTKPAYDVLPILKELHENLPDLFEKWISEVNKAGYSPIVEAIKQYQALAANKKLRGEADQTFISTVNELFEWVIRLGPFQLTQKYINSENSAAVTLANLAMSIPIECGRHQQNQLALFKILIKLSKEFNKVDEFLTQKNEKDDVLIVQAIMFDKPNVVELILDTASEMHLIHGTHNAIKENELEVVVHKTIIMYMIEMRMWELIPKVNASSEFWKSKDAKGNSVWHYAARVNSHKTVGLFKMIESKGVRRETNDDGRSVLHVATLACDGSADSVLEPIAWLSTRCPIDAVDKFNRTALHYAFGNENDFKEGNVPFGESDPIAVVSLLSSLIRPEQIEIADVNGNTILHLAAIKNSTICLMTLIRKKCHVDLKNKDGNTPLALAVHHGRQSSALTLIQANADVTEKIFVPALKPTSDFDQNSSGTEAEKFWKWHGKEKKVLEDLHTTIPASVVSKGGSWEAMVYVLLDVLGQNTGSMAQLTDAALRRGQLNLANQLLKSIEALIDGAVLNSSYDLLDTFAEKCFGALTSEETIEKTVLNRIILTRGLGLKQPETMKIIRTALQNGNWNLLNFLKSEMGTAWKNQKIETPTENPIRSLLIYMNEKSVSSEAIGFLEELRQMRGVNIDALCQLEIPGKFKKILDYGLIPPISFAVLQENPNMIRALRNAGASLKTQDDYGRTPLMYAIMTNNRSVVDAIVGDGKLAVVLHKQKAVATGPRCVAVPMRFGATSRAFIPAAAFASVPARVESDEEEEDNSGSESGEDGAASENKSEHGSENGESGNGSDDEDDDDDDSSPPPAKKSRIAKEAAGPSTGPKRKKLVITDPSLFSARDHKENNPLHYFIEPLAWENVELLGDLAAANKTAIVQCLIDKRSPNPIELAAMKMNRRMKSEMLKIVKNAAFPRPIKETKLTLQQVHIEPLSDVDEDAAKFLAKWVEEKDKKKTSEAPKPHKSSTYSTNGLVSFCDETQQYFDVLMNKTDLMYGRCGFHNFYRMQIIKRRDAELFILFTNWGRIGSGMGEFQTTPFNSLELAAKEFKSIFKSKSGNEWAPLANFRDMPKKYRLVETDSTPTSLAEIELTWKKNTEKDPIRRMIADISDAKTLKTYASQVQMYGGSSQPFGRFTKENIEKAKLVLDKLEKNANRIKQMVEAQTGVVESNLLDAYITTSELSGDYYSLIPSGEYEFSNLTRLDNVEEIARHRARLNRCQEIETATRLLCAAEFRQDLDRVDYIRSAIQCEYRLETPDSDISQRLLQWIHNSGGKQAKVKMILEISPMLSTEKFEPFVNDDNQKFLWHGTKATNLMSILKNGFLIDPPSACKNGNLFGSGIYLADSFEKSTHYCQPSAGGINYMLVCQTALGKVRTLDTIPYHYMNQSSSSAEKYEDTLHYIGDRFPAGSLTNDGVGMPLLPLRKRDPIQGSNYGFGTLDFSEYIVRNPNRVLPKYIVMYK